MTDKKKNTFTNQPVITAVDLGSDKITTLIAIVDHLGNLEVKGLGEVKSCGIESGIVKDINLTSGAIKKSLNMAEESSDIKAENIFVSIAGKFIKSTNANSRLPISDQMKDEMGEITQEHIDKVVNTAVELVLTQEGDKNQKLIHSIPQYYKVDEQDNIFNPLNMSGSILTAHVHVVLADINCIRNIHKCFELIGYKVQQLVLAPLATSRAVLTEDEKNLGCVLVDIGAGTTDIVFFFKNSIMLSTVNPYGGSTITSDISRLLQTSAQAAEKLKITLGSALVPQDDNNSFEEQIEVQGIGGREPSYKSLSLLCDITQSRIQEILESTYRTITAVNFQDFIFAGLVLTGGTSLLNNIDELASEIFNMPVRIGYPNTNKIIGEKNKLSDPKYTTVVGVLYYAKDCIKTSEIKKEDTADIRKSVVGIAHKIYSYISDFF